MSNEIASKLVDKLVDKLLALSPPDLEVTEERASYFMNNEEVKGIGERLYAIGGHALMYDVYSSLAALYHKTAMRELEFAWDGVGKWRC